MRNYIFLSKEGYTYQPDSESYEPDIENLQVIGFGKGLKEEEAFNNFIKENHYLLDTSFDEVFALQLNQNSINPTKSYSIKGHF